MMSEICEHKHFNIANKDSEFEKRFHIEKVALNWFL